MAPSVVNKGTFHSSSASPSITLGWTPTSGNTLAIAFGGSGSSGDPQITGATQGGSGTGWSVTATQSTGQTTGWAYNQNCGTSTAVAVSTSGGSGTIDIFLTVYEIGGCLTSGGPDQTGTHGAGTSNSPWTVSTGGATAQASEIALATMCTFGGTANPAITGPSSPWVNTTNSVSNHINQISGSNILSSTGTITYNGTATSSGTPDYGASIITFKAILNTTSSGGVTLKPALAGTGLGGDTTTSGGVTLKPALAGTGAETFASTGAITLLPQLAATGYQSLPFPVIPLGIKIELLINGTWTDITTYMYQRADMVITTGRPDESQQIQPASCTFTLNNRDSSFSPYDSDGQFYPFLSRNTQCRVSVLALSADGTNYSGYRFWGEIPAWPPVWDTTGADVTAVVTVSGVTRRLTANTRNIGSALYRYYSKLTGAGAPVAYWPCEDASSATQLASAVSGGTAMTWTGTPSLASDTSVDGSDAFPQLNGSVWTGDVSGSATPSPAVYTSPGTHNWTCPGDVTSLTSAEAWGSGSGAAGGSANFGFLGGGGGAYAKITSVAVTPGNVYALTVPAGGFGTNDLSQSGNGASASATFDSASVIAVGGTAPVGTSGSDVGKGGLASHCTGSTKHSGGDGGNATQAGGAGGGSSAGTGSDGNDGSDSSSDTGGSGGSAPTGGGKGGKGGNNSAPGGAGAIPGGGAGGAGGGGTGTAYSGGNGGAGQVKLTYSSSGAPAVNSLRTIIDVPSTGGTNGAILAEWTTSGTITTVDIVYGTGGTLEVIGYNVSHVSKFSHTSGDIANGQPMMVQVSLSTSGTGVAWSFDYIKPGDVASTNISSGTVTSSSVGGVIEFDANVGGTETTAVGLGQVTVQYAVTPLSDMGTVLAAYAGERAADRVSRLCAEQGIGFELTGTASDTAQMGPQTDAPIVQLLQECEDADKGLLYEPRDMFGLGYRTRVSMQNQDPGATLDYTAYEVGEAVPQPDNDELLVVNDLTLSRTNGSSFEVTLMTGALSVLDPPDGVGYYSQAYTYNFYADSQLENATTWGVDVGTVDEFRWPSIEADLRRSALAGDTFGDVPGLAIGDFLEMVNPPAFVQSAAVDQLVYGYTETLNAFQWLFDFNCVPESPYEGAGLPTW